ncbi:hypothetical protein [Longispora fulva]|uniref:Uncharacterized protein n=1 Tax=Longispora fulva TaxID=619741 RepID=A0A8J7G970_9ACTN|nr:hypothetical protein [Longispora fulva]MBG6136053.1 hypothetical protein [Longispora fulva]
MILYPWGMKPWAVRMRVRVQIGPELRQLREAVGVSGRDVAAYLDW